MEQFISEREAERVETAIRQAVADGASLVTGGERSGAVVAPTIVADVSSELPLFHDELFGPAVTVTPVDGIDEAIALANDSDYGLGANLYSNDPKKVKQYYEEVKAGTCWVNDPLTDNDAGPFGGMKFSGGARELGEEGLEEFLKTKHVHWDFAQERKSWWYPYNRPEPAP